MPALKDTTVTICPGDTVTKLAFLNGHHPNTVWNHGNNAQLKDQRKSMDILFPGDELFIPRIRIKEVDRPDKAKHTFHRKGVPTKLQIRFLDYDGEPLSNQPWKLTIGALVKEGYTDGDGLLKCSIPPNAATGALLVGKDGSIENCELQFGHTNPLTEISGIKQRLFNLGYYSGPLDEIEDQLLANAIADFRKDHDLSDDAGLDDDFRNKLKEIYQS